MGLSTAVIHDPDASVRAFEAVAALAARRAQSLDENGDAPIAEVEALADAGLLSFHFRLPSAGRAWRAAKRLRERWRRRCEFLVEPACRSDAFMKATSTRSGWWRHMGAFRSAPEWQTRPDEGRCSAFGPRTRTRRAYGFVLREAH